MRAIQPMLTRVAGLWSGNGETPAFSPAQRWILALLVAAAALVRFWGVGSLGLHAPDEATTALPALHILEDGWPRFPSGMLYTRAVAHLYLVAGSVAVFGNNEWALRLPSVLCGTALVPLCVLVGRRFLRPGWNLAFAAVIAFLPGLITDSQVVRMYVFLIAALALYSHWIFRWESTSRPGFLAAAVLTMIIGIHFHQLAIFGSLVIVMPSLLHGDARRLRQACLAFVPIALYFVYIRWTPSQYPLPITDFPVPDSTVGRVPLVPGSRLKALAALLLLAAAALFCWYYARGRRPRDSVGVCLPALAASACAAVMHYHLALVFVAWALVAAGRQGRLRMPVVVAAMAPAAIVGAYQLQGLMGSGGLSLRKALGVMVGQPSVWQYAALAGFSTVAALVVAGGALQALRRLCTSQPILEVWLYFALAVAVPLFLMGFTDWYFPPRYVEFSLVPFLLTACVVGQSLADRFGMHTRRGMESIAAALLAAVLVNPSAALASMGPRAGFADHRGAAQFVGDRKKGAGDIVVAEDVLYPWYYLGHVDYWLMGRLAAKNFAERVNGQVVYQYTHTPLIGTAAELQALIDRPGRGTLYIIGSGEDMADGRRYLRGDDIADLLQSGRLPLAFVGGDGLTRVWRLPPNPPSAD